MKFPILRISSVNVTKSAGNCRFGHNYGRNADADGNVDIEFLQHRKEVEIFLLYQKLSSFISKTQSF